MTEEDNIAGFPGYRIDQDGSLWTRLTRGGHKPRSLGNVWRKRKPGVDVWGYLYVHLYRNGKGYHRKIHHLVLEAFVGPRPPGLEACHNNGITSDCRLSNLRWDTKANNVLDKIKHGVTVRGTKQPKAKLTDDDVREIRRRLKTGETSRSIGAAFGVARSTIRNIKAGYSWSWLDREERAAANLARQGA